MNCAEKWISAMFRVNVSSLNFTSFYCDQNILRLVFDGSKILGGLRKYFLSLAIQSELPKILHGIPREMFSSIQCKRSMQQHNFLLKMNLKGLYCCMRHCAMI